MVQMDSKKITISIAPELLEKLQAVSKSAEEKYDNGNFRLWGRGRGLRSAVAVRALMLGLPQVEEELDAGGVAALFV